MVVTEIPKAKNLNNKKKSGLLFVECNLQSWEVFQQQE